MRAMTLLNTMGDLTIVWDEDKDAEMEEIIKKKMKQGVTFFIVEPRLGGKAAPKKTKLKRAGDAKKHRTLAIPDEDIAKFIESGSGAIVKTPEKKVSKSRISRDAREVSQSQSVGVRQAQGG